MCNLLRLCLTGVFLVTHATSGQSAAVLQGTVTFLNSGSRPAVGVKISAFGANDSYTTDAGMFRLEFSDKKPGDRVKIIVGSTDKSGFALELVNDRVLEQIRIPSNPEEDIIEIIVCKNGQRNDAALRYNGLIVKTINAAAEKRLKAIDDKLGALVVDTEIFQTLKRERKQIAVERDSALAKAEEQALYIASINLDKASQLLKDAVMMVDSLMDISKAIEILDNERLLETYDESKAKIEKARNEISHVIEGFKLKINLLSMNFRTTEVNICCLELERICREQNTDIQHHCFDWTTLDDRELQLIYQKVDGNHRTTKENMRFFSSFSLACNLLETEEQKQNCQAYALRLKEKILGESHPAVAASYFALAQSFINYDNKKAIELYQKGIAIQESNRSFSSALVHANSRIAICYSMEKEPAKALEYNSKALEGLIMLSSPNQNLLREVYRTRGALLQELGDYNEALEFSLKALAVSLANDSILDDRIVGHDYYAVATAYLNVGDFTNALTNYLKAQPTRESYNAVSKAWGYSDIAYAHCRLFQFQEAKDYLERAQSLANDPAVFRNWAVYYAMQNDKDKSIENLKKAVSLGFKDLKWIQSDAGLDGIRSEPGYEAIVEELMKRR